MKNKKGFTIIEIIVSLIIILLIGGTVIGLTITNNKKKEEKVLEVTKKIQEAANVYFSINKELDSSIENKIYEGGTGYVMPLKTLLQEGYISNNYIKTLEDNIEKFNINEHYMMMAEYAKTREECDNAGSVIEIETSWIKNENLNHGGTYFICNYEHRENQYHYLFLDVNSGQMSSDRVYIKPSSEEINITLPTPTKNGYDFVGWYEGETKITDTSIILTGADSKVLEAKYQKKKTIYNEIKERYESEGISGCIPGVTTGLCMIKGNDITENNKEIYYFAGNSTSNNYVKIGSYYYHIVRTTEDNNIKLVRNLAYYARLHYTDISGNFSLTSNPYIKVSNESIGISRATQNLSYKSGEMTLSLSGMLNIAEIEGWNRGSGANSYETPDGYSLCNQTTNNKNWTDNELCYVTWCFKRWGGTGNSCNSTSRYNLSFYSPMHSIYLDTKTKINSFSIPSNYLVNTKWCLNSKYNSSEVKNYCRDENCFTVFPNVNLTCEESDYIESKFGLLNKAEYFLITHFTESTYELHAGKLYLYGTGVNSEASYEATLDNTYSYEIIGNTYYFTHGNKENQLVYRPAITIKGDLKITAGDGSYSNPYKLSL